MIFFNLNTGERVRASYWEDGHYLSDGLAELNHIFRDYRRNEVFNIDRKLFDQLFLLQHKLGATAKSSSSRVIAPRPPISRSGARVAASPSTATTPWGRRLTCASPACSWRTCARPP